MLCHALSLEMENCPLTDLTIEDFPVNAATLADSCLVVKSCLTLCDPMDQSTPGPPVFHWLPELDQIHVDSFDDTVHPSHPLSSPSPLALTLSQH